MKTKLYSQIRFVQSTDEDYNRIEAVFSGLRAGYCEGNSQPVIDYLSDWDDEEDIEWEEVGSCWGFFMETEELIDEVISEYSLKSA